MADCSKCGKEEMTFTCRYCDQKFCSEHRLPENHDCPNLEDATSGNQKWFKDAEKVQNTPASKSRPEKPSLLKDISDALKSNLTLLIIGITTLSFFLQLTFEGYSELLFLHPELSELIARPWSLLTVMLVHGGQLHLFANMITLYFFGRAIETAVSKKEFLTLYIGAGLISSLAYVAFRNIMFLVYGAEVGGFATLSPAVGASGAVVATFAAASVIYPRAEVLLYFVIPMKISSAMKLFAGIETANLLLKAAGYTLPIIGNFASSAHLAGLLIGVWYGKKIVGRKKGTLQLDLMRT